MSGGAGTGRGVLADGTVVHAEAVTIWPHALAAAAAHWRRFERGRRRSCPPVTVRRRHRGTHLTGRCHLDRERRVVVTLPASAGLAEASFLLLHELSHAALPARARHGIEFRETFAQATSTRWPALAGILAPVPRTARGLDRLVLGALSDLLSGPVPSDAPR